MPSDTEKAFGGAPGGSEGSKGPDPPMNSASRPGTGPSPGSDPNPNPDPGSENIGTFFRNHHSPPIVHSLS